MSYHHLTTCDRGRIEALHKEGYSARRIGAAMGRHHSSISREMIKNNGFVYVAGEMLSTPTKKDEKDPNLRENSLLSWRRLLEAKLAEYMVPRADFQYRF